MAKVKGPLFSLAATGEFRGMEFRTGNGETTVAAPREITAPRRPAQVAQSNRFKIATSAWRELDTAEKDLWKTSAAPLSISGYNLYVSEYINQNVTPPGQPNRPT